MTGTAYFPVAAAMPCDRALIAVGNISDGIKNVVVFGPKLQKREITRKNSEKK